MTQKLNMSEDFLSRVSETKIGIGSRIKDLRCNLLPNSLSQQELADVIKVKNGTQVHYWESGKRVPDTDSLLKISIAFDVSLDWLVLGKGEPHGIPDEVYDSLSDISKSIKKINSMTKKGIE